MMWARSRVVVVLPFVPVIATSGMRPVRAPGKEHVHDRLGHVAREPLAGGEVHPEAGRRVDLDDPPAALGEVARAGPER